MSIKVVDFKSELAASELVESLHECGFAVLKNHDISPEVFRELYTNWTDFFESNYKKDFLMGKNDKSGFVPQSVAEVPKSTKIRDIKEFYDYIDGDCC